MDWWRRLRRVLDTGLEGLLAIVMTVLVVDVTWQVFTRYVLNNPSSWTEELATYLMIWVGLLGASVALRRGAHLGIDYFVSHLSPRKRAATEVFAFLITGLFSVLVLGIGGARLVLQTLERGQTSPALDLKMGHVYLALPISGFFLALYSVEALLERVVRTARGAATHGAT
ncbi:MAG: TRAP transporter small permease [Planctomycetes bacterium]|nr:TRAP transporter small permease [Planctomycetota bacterium]